MHSGIEDWKNGWYRLRIGLSEPEIDKLIENLKTLKQDPGQHFHLSSDGKGKGGLGDIEISRQADNEVDNTIIFGQALLPGAEIEMSDQPPSNRGTFISKLKKKFKM
jgi:hypothetical protein